MTSYIGEPPQERTIPVTLGCDKLFTVQRTQNGAPTAFDSGTTVYMWIDIDKTAPTKVNAVVSGTNAAFTIPSEVADLTRTGTRWRIVNDYGTTEIPILVGRFERHDG